MAQAVNRRRHTVRPGFNSKLVVVISVVDRVALGQAFLRVFRVFPVCIVPPLLHTHVQRSLMGVLEEAILDRK